MTFREYQTIVDDWIKEHGVRYFSEMTNLAQLMEEVGELARVMSRTYGDQSFKPSDKEISLADELADIFFVITCIANQTGIDMTGAIRKNLDKKTRRDSKRHKNNPKLVK
ncbi:MAG: nucleotide pyrophosphohydrolase [Deltaproteobacteria bacterium]|nr:nucleotide pyrophosphohydrolase [Deltaproteobacteria bacterium]